MTESLEHLDETLSAYVDGELDAAAQARVESHVAGCDACAALLDELRAVRASALALPDVPPETDLWPAIEARLAPPRRVLRLPEHASRTLRFSIPQLAAAGFLIAALSGGSVWWLAAHGLVAHRNEPALAARMPGTPGGPIAPAASAARETPTGGTSSARSRDGSPTPAGETSSAPAGGVTPGITSSPGASLAANPPAGAGTDAAAAAFDSRPYDRALADLQQVFDRNRSRLDPKTIQQVESNLAAIDAAIGQAKRALAADPANVYLNDHLADQFKRKVRVLQQTADAVTAYAAYTGS